jgi:hypothetical protein
MPASFPNTPLPPWPPLPPLEGWQKLLRNPDEADHLLVAEELGGQVVGYARGGENVDDDELSYPGAIVAFHVLDYQGHSSAARTLLETLLAHLATHSLLPAVANTPSTSPLRPLFDQVGGRVIAQDAVAIQGETHERLRYVFGTEVRQS